MEWELCEMILTDKEHSRVIASEGLDCKYTDDLVLIGITKGRELERTEIVAWLMAQDVVEYIPGMAIRLAKLVGRIERAERSTKREEPK